MQVAGKRDTRTQRVVSLDMVAHTATDELLLTEIFRVMDQGHEGQIMVTNAKDNPGQIFIWNAKE